MLLQCFECIEETRTLASLAKQSGLYKSTILRLASSMCMMGFLLRLPNGLFSIGPELTRFGSSNALSVDTEKTIRAGLRDLAAKTEGRVSFHVRQDRRQACLFLESGSHTVRTSDDERAMDLSAADATTDVIRAYGRCSRDSELALVRRRGWVFSMGKRHSGMALAVPVLNREKELLGVLTVSGTWRYLNAEKQSALRHAAQASAQDMGLHLRFVHPSDVGQRRSAQTLVPEQ
jgi:DNA-binding IclR family transcriptional regulator